MLPIAKRWLSTSLMPPRSPLIAIVGATGTGKSQLAVSLAQRFNGEIINGDALQMYEGLPIVTNKMPFVERKGIPHHLLACIKLEEEPWTVKQFVDRAGKVTEEIRARNKLPILVGGTHYYTQSLLFRNAIVDEDCEHMTNKDQEQKWPILNAGTEDMLDELRKVDPQMASRWHPNDRRKIRRSLEVYLTTGRKASDIYRQQRQSPADIDGDNSFESANDTIKEVHVGPESRFRYDTLIFWTHTAREVLNSRLDKRVDKMIANGLLDEVRSMHDFLKEQEEQGRSLDQSRGLWIAIGFKELMPYIVNGNPLEISRQESIERAKISTRQYAKSQFRWIKLKLQRAVLATGSNDGMFLLDCSDLSEWSRAVEAKASQITANFLRGSALPPPTSLSVAARENLGLTEESNQSARFCEACNRTLMTEQQWVGHLRSKGHMGAVRPKIDWGKTYPKANRTR